jgi:hypothetical protein
MKRKWDETEEQCRNYIYRKYSRQRSKKMLHEIE